MYRPTICLVYVYNFTFYCLKLKRPNVHACVKELCTPLNRPCRTQLYATQQTVSHIVIQLYATQQTVSDTVQIIVISTSFLSLNRICLEETMRASVVLLFAFLALAFVSAQAAAQEEADDPSLSANEDSDDVSSDGARVKRAAPPKAPCGVKIQEKWRSGGCYAACWGSCDCHKKSYGLFCHRHGSGYGGCQIYIWKNGGWNECASQGPRGGRGWCYKNIKKVTCKSP
ncbi:hypothetical protein LSAT2_000651 [Lamellibrachia satsuma]|nr:hypothetical protein LSAT2_000651 [Lamellibrachia satsuma]